MIATKKRTPITAGEFLKQLEADPEFMQRKAVRDRELAELQAASRAAQKALLADLLAVGVKVESVWDLATTRRSLYPAAIPVLLDHLQRTYPDGVREGIARALAIKATRKLGWRILVDQFCRTPVENERVKDGLAIALWGASDATVRKEIIGLLKDRQHGASRVLLLQAIRRSKDPEAKQAIEELADDPDLTKEISAWRRGRRKKDHG